MAVAPRLALLSAALRSALSTEGAEGSAAPLRAFATSAASLGGIDALDSGEITLPPPGAEDFVAAPRAPKNEARVRESVLAVASRVAQEVRSGRSPVLFGGDSMILMGLLAGVQDAGASPIRLGLLSFDGRARFRSSADSDAADLTSMVISMATGRGPLALTHLARDVFPLVQETDVVLSGVRDADPSEASALVKSRMALLTPDRLLGAEGVGQFMTALGRLSHSTRHLAVHFDASVLEPRLFPAATGTPSEGGISIDRLKTLCNELSNWNSDGTIRIRGVSVSGIDSRKDPGGARTHEVARLVLRLFARR